MPKWGCHHKEFIKRSFCKTVHLHITHILSESFWIENYEIYGLKDQYFLWGQIKNAVYNRKSETLQGLKDFIEEEAGLITAEWCENAIQKFHESLKFCIDNSGSSVEKYLC